MCYADASPGRAELRKCPSGIQGLDEITSGGLPAGRPTLVCGGPGCGDETAPELAQNVRSLARAVGKVCGGRAQPEPVLRGAPGQILAIPTLVRRLPEPLRKIVGDLSNTERMLVGFDLRPLPAAES